MAAPARREKMLDSAYFTLFETARRSHYASEDIFRVCLFREAIR